MRSVLIVKYPGCGVVLTKTHFYYTSDFVDMIYKYLTPELKEQCPNTDFKTWADEKIKSMFDEFNEEGSTRLGECFIHEDD